MDTTWFEMTDIRPVAKRSWIPLAADVILCQQGKYRCPGYQKEYFGAWSILMPDNSKDPALQLDWSSITPLSSHSPEVSDNDYIPSQEFVGHPSGVYMVLQQQFDSGEPRVWTPNQDLVLALRLIREGNSWLCPDEDYAEVLRLQVDNDNVPILIEARAEYLHDYLNARHAGLLISTYQNRLRVLPDPDELPWEGGYSSHTLAHGHWEGRGQVVHEGAGLFDGEWVVHRLSRTDVDYADPLPIFDFPTNSKVQSQTYTIKPKGQPHLLVSGQMWLNEWFPPGSSSPRVRGDSVEPSIPFIIDHASTRATTKALIGSNRYLWFKPTLINALLHRRGGSLFWYTEDTGSVGAAPHRKVHFGMNSLGLVNVFAKDIGKLPETHQLLWAPHNITPDGGVCPELLRAQQACEPANTLAPEMLFLRHYAALHQVSLRTFGRSLFRRLPSPDQLVTSLHRFRSLDLASLCTLAKDVTRHISDNFDLDLLKQLKPNEPKDLKSLKRIERLLTASGHNGRTLIGPLAGVYELRLADAHDKTLNLPSTFKLIGIDDNGYYPIMGKHLIYSAASVLEHLARILPTIKTNATPPAGLAQPGES